MSHQIRYVLCGHFGGYWVYPSEHVGGVIVCHNPAFDSPLSQRGDRLWGLREIFDVSYLFDMLGWPARQAQPLRLSSGSVSVELSTVQ